MIPEPPSALPLVYGAVLSAAAAWGLVAGRAHYLLRRMRFVRPLDGWPDGAVDQPRVGIVVPARDEADAIEACVRSLLAQRHVDLRVLVVNDGSTDGTRAILERLAHEDSRLELLHDPALPEGWLGKTNALHQGAALLADRDWLLFSDADVVHHPRSAITGVDLLRREDRTLLSVLPRFHWVSLVEHGMLVMFLTAVLRFASTSLEDPGRPRDAAGSGSYNLVHAPTYRQLGAHEPLRAAIIDDIGLALHWKAHQQPVAFRMGPELVALRMYRGNRAAFWGMAKNALASLGNRVWLAPIMAALMLWLLLTAPLAMVVGAVLGDPELAVLGLALYAIQYRTLLPLRETHSFSPTGLLAFPVFALSITACLARGVADYSRGHVTWRDRRVDLR